MSYILDALRRSEQDRQQDQIRSLTASDPILHVTKGKKPLWPYFLVLAVFANAGALLWTHFSPHHETLLSDSPLVQATQDIPVSAPVSSDLKDNNEVPEDSTSVQIKSPPTQTSANQHSISKSDTASPNNLSVNSKSVSSQVVNNDSAQENLVAHQLQASENTDTLVAATNTATLTPTPFRQEEPEPYVIKPRKQRALPDDLKYSDYEHSPNVVVASEPLSLPQEFEENTYQDVPFLHELDDYTKRRIPDLTFNSHIYADIPSARRVMINNIFLKEGQQLRGLTVTMIGEKNIVFELEGQYFKRRVMDDWP